MKKKENSKPKPKEKVKKKKTLDEIGKEMQEGRIKALNNLANHDKSI